MEVKTTVIQMTNGRDRNNIGEDTQPNCFQDGTFHSIIIGHLKTTLANFKFFPIV